MKTLALCFALFALHAEAQTNQANKATCGASCDKRASLCDDACEANHKDAKVRIECKMSCIAERARCEKGCE